MPATYSIDHSRRLIFEVWSGDVTVRDVRSLWKKYLSDPQVMAIRKTLADLRHCNLLINGRDIMELVEKVAVPGLHGLDWKTAIVVDQPDQYGFSHQFQVFAEVYNKNSIFYDYEKALAWIMEQ
jgi:hypothetical protein